MRSYIQLTAILCAGACSAAGECCNDYTPPTYAIADATILDPAGAPVSQHAVTVTSFDPGKCSDADLPKAARFRATLTTDQTGHAIGSMTITPFLLASVDACLTFTAQGGAVYRDTAVSGIDVTFRQAGALLDTARVTIKLTAK